MGNQLAALRDILELCLLDLVIPSKPLGVIIPRYNLVKRKAKNHIKKYKNATKLGRYSFIPQSNK
jgi:hypothetical protein